MIKKGFLAVIRFLFSHVLFRVKYLGLENIQNANITNNVNIYIYENYDQTIRTVIDIDNGWCMRSSTGQKVSFPREGVQNVRCIKR